MNKIKKVIGIIVIILLVLLMLLVAYCIKENTMEKYGIIDFSGKQIVDYKYEIISIEDFFNCEKYIWVSKNKGIFSNETINYYIDLNGNEYKNKKIYNEIDENEFEIIKIDGKYGIQNANGELIIECKYDKILEFSKSLFKVSENNIWKIIDVNNSLIAYYDDNNWNFENYKYSYIYPLMKVTENHSEMDSNFLYAEKEGKLVIIDYTRKNYY